jgi:heme oxygenase (mycobilin-producing)
MLHCSVTRAGRGGNWFLVIPSQRQSLSLGNLPPADARQLLTPPQLWPARIDAPGSANGGEMFVALSRFIVANDKSDAVQAAFRNRPHLVDRAPGFLSMQVMCPIDGPDEVWLVTHWRNEESYRTWHRSHEYHEAHKGIPKGLKLVPGSANVRCFEVFAD